MNSVRHSFCKLALTFGLFLASMPASAMNTIEIDRSLPEVAVNEVACTGATAEMSVKGRIDEESMRVLKIGIAEAVNSGVCDIKLSMNSGGGSLVHAMAVARFMRSLPEAVTFRAYVGTDRQCGSSCTVLYAAADVREASPRANFMFHPPKVFNAAESRGIAIMMARLWLAEIERIDPILSKWLVDHDVLRPDGPRRDIFLSASEVRKISTGWVNA